MVRCPRVPTPHLTSPRWIVTALHCSKSKLAFHSLLCRELMRWNGLTKTLIRPYPTTCIRNGKHFLTSYREQATERLYAGLQLLKLPNPSTSLREKASGTT